MHRRAEHVLVERVAFGPIVRAIGGHVLFINSFA
jgi:hypothetical protein